MAWKSILTTGFVLGAIGLVTQPSAQTLPPLLANLSAAPDDEFMNRALIDRIVTTFPKDIGSATLGKLLDLDGFDIEETDEGISASLTEYEFPCITSYIVTWGQSDAGRVEGLEATVKQKCV